MDLTTEWTGHTACALQAAMRMSNQGFARHLNIGVRTVASWHQKPTLRPQSSVQQALDKALERAAPTVKERFAALLGNEPPAPPDAPEDSKVATAAERRFTTDPNMSAALEWLDRHAGWQPGTARREVASRLAQLDVRQLQDRANRRGRVNQRNIAEALGEYYGDRIADHGPVAARYGADREAITSIVTRPAWLDLDCPLTPVGDRLNASAALSNGITLDEQAASCAAQRLAETLVMDVRLVDMPLYRLVDIDVRRAAIGGSLGVTPFVAYALTADLLEGELLDALAGGVPPLRGSLPLRDSLLPDLAAVLDVSSRLCAGGTLALSAFARPASPLRGPADYVLLVQERSGNVVNAARRLAVIPKGFHQPMTDLRADARVGATLLREMEEELFGRDEVDSTLGDQRRADPMHPSRLTEPMRWLLEERDRLKMECTGFGLNLVSGNFEFASLIVIEDQEFWTRFGGEVAANWESSGLRQYSSLDGELLAELADDRGWSNEGLFALLAGLRRLKALGGNRVDLPTIEWEVPP